MTGDLIAKSQDGRPLPGVAQLAIQSGAHAAANLKRSLLGAPRKAFRYVDKGSMATIGRNKAVAQVGRLQFTGVLAWLLWLLVHILFLVESRSRIGVLFEWAWAYLTWQRSSRVIVEVPLEMLQPLTAADPPHPPMSPGRPLREDSPPELEVTADEPDDRGPRHAGPRARPTSA